MASQGSDGDFGLRVFSAMAVLRGFFSILAKFVAKNPFVLKEESPYNQVMIEINSLLKNPKPSLQLFFLKQLHQDASLFDLQKWFGESNALSSIEEL